MADTIHGTSGNDNLENTIAGAMVYGYEGNDTITNKGDDVYISGGADNDTITSRYADNVTIHGDDGHEKITVSGSNTQTYGENGNDYVYNDGDYAYIDGGNGKDTVSSWGSNVSIYGGVDDDYLAITGSMNAGRNALLSGDSGDDTIVTQAGIEVSIVGGVGNDYIKLETGSATCFIQYAAGDGDDTVSGFSDNDTLNIAGNYSTQESGNDVLVNVDSGSILLQNAKGKTLNITGGSITTTGGGDDTPPTGGNSALIIENDTPHTLISGTNYNDSIYNSGDYATIKTYWGDDTVNNLGDTIQIDTGSGNDSIYSHSYYGTINAGTGDDTVSLGSSAHDNIIQYANGNGNDVIYNLGANNTLNITGGAYSSQTSGNNILVTVGTGTITLAGAASLGSVNIIGTANTPQGSSNHVYTGGNAVVSNYVGEQIIVGMLPKEWMFYGSDFYYGSNTGTLVVQNVQNKIIDFRDGNGNSFVKAYTSTTAGVINGRGLSGFEYIVGSNTGADAIFAGDGGSSLWGGNGNYSDTLIGGAETDVFVSGKSQGNDVITNASIADVVWLRDVNFSDIRYTAESNGTIGIAFNTGNSVLVGSTSNISAIFQFADGTNRRFNHATKSWQSA